MLSGYDLTESEWLRGRKPEDLLLYLYYVVKPSLRKFRLFNCGCLRRGWAHLHDDTLRQGIETCERFIEGTATAEDLEEARNRANRLALGTGDIIEDHGPMAVEALCSSSEGHSVFPASKSAAAVAAEASPNDGGPDWSVDHSKERAIQCDLLREIIGNPFRPVRIEPTWATDSVRSIAQGIYDEIAFDRLAVLGDALQDAGCAEEQLLAHCRQPTGHVRGCWVVDLVLGKS